MTIDPIPDQVPCLSPVGFHAMAYVSWGGDTTPDGPAHRPAICAHGLTRNGRDFDFLARDLALDRLVVCPDTVGRGESDWLRDPMHYALPQYAADMTSLLSRLHVEEVDWIGTSMGGLIGMLLAASPGSPVRRLVINDIGPVIPQEGLDRIGDYLGVDWLYDTFDEAVAHTRRVHAPFGDLSDGQWRHLARHGFRKRDDGRYVPNHDPRLAAPFKTLTAASFDLWALFEAISCPVLVLRGADSDLLTEDIAGQMAARGKNVEIVTFDGCGHAPPLMAAEQIGAVRAFLDAS